MNPRGSPLMAMALAGLLASGSTSAADPQTPAASQAGHALDRSIEQRME